MHDCEPLSQVPCPLHPLRVRHCVNFDSTITTVIANTRRIYIGQRFVIPQVSSTTSNIRHCLQKPRVFRILSSPVSMIDRLNCANETRESLDLDPENPKLKLSWNHLYSSWIFMDPSHLFNLLHPHIYALPESLRMSGFSALHSSSFQFLKILNFELRESTFDS